MLSLKGLRGTLVCFALCLAGGLGALPASAAPTPQAHLLYVREAGADRCPEEAEVRGVVTTRLGYDPFSERAPTTVSVTLSHPPRGLRARIELVDATGEVTGARELTSKRGDCSELASAVELAISLAIDPLSFAGGPPPAETIAPTAKPNVTDVNANLNANVNANANTNVTANATAKPERLRARLGAGALVSLGSAPGVTFGFTIKAGIRRVRWSMNLEVRADLPSSAQAAGGTITTALYTGSAIPCFHQGLFAGCAIAMLGGQISSGANFPISKQVSTVFAAGGVRAALEIPIWKKLELHIEADLLAAITRTTLTVDQDNNVVFRTPPVSGAFHLAMLGYFR